MILYLNVNGDNPWGNGLNLTTFATTNNVKVNLQTILNNKKSLRIVSISMAITNTFLDMLMQTNLWNVSFNLTTLDTTNNVFEILGIDFG